MLPEHMAIDLSKHFLIVHMTHQTYKSVVFFRGGRICLSSDFIRTEKGYKHHFLYIHKPRRGINEIIY